MSLQQREMVRQILRDAPFDLGGEAHTQRPLLEQMLTARPMPEDVRTTPGELGGVPAVFIDLDQPPSRRDLAHARRRFRGRLRRRLGGSRLGPGPKGRHERGVG